MFGQTQVGAMLHDEHLQTIRALQHLEEFLAKQTHKKIPDLAQPAIRKVFDEVVTSISAEVTRHFGFEENNLFPVLADQGEVGIVAMLTEEHSVIRPLAQSLADDARGALAGTAFSADSWRDFHARGLELCEREIFHIQKEEMGLLAAIASLVDPDTDRELAMAYSQAR